MEGTKEEMGREEPVSQTEKDKLKETKEENYPSVFSGRTPSQDLKRLKGRGRIYQSIKKEE